MARMTKTQIEYLENKLNSIAIDLINKAKIKAGRPILQAAIDKLSVDKGAMLTANSGLLTKEELQRALVASLKADHWRKEEVTEAVLRKTHIYKKLVTVPHGKLKKQIDAIDVKIDAYAAELKLEVNKVMDRAVMGGSTIDLEQVTKALAAIK